MTERLNDQEADRAEMLDWLDVQIERKRAFVAGLDGCDTGLDMLNLANKYERLRILLAHPTPVGDQEGLRQALTDLIGGPDHRLGGEDNPEAKDTAPLSVAINFGKLRRARAVLAQPTSLRSVEEDQGADSGSPTSRRGSLITELVEALQPFSDIAKHNLGAPFPDEHLTDLRDVHGLIAKLSVSVFRRARAAVAAYEAQA